MIKLMAKRKTHEEFLHDVFNKVGDEYEVRGIYKNSSTPIEIYHKKCNHSYFPLPNNFFK